MPESLLGHTAKRGVVPYQHHVSAAVVLTWTFHCRTGSSDSPLSQHQAAVMRLVVVRMLTRTLPLLWQLPRQKQRLGRKRRWRTSWLA